MYSRSWITCFITGLILTSPSLSAKSPIDKEQLQVPHCLAKALSPSYPVMAESALFKVIEVPAQELDQIVKVADKVHCGRFVNVTHRIEAKTQALRLVKAKQLLSLKPAKKTSVKEEKNYPISHQTLVFSLLDEVSQDNIMATLTRLTNFENRSATKDTGVQAANWLKSSFEEMAKTYNRADTNTYFVKTGSRYKQPSLVTVIGKDIDAPAVVIGAHMDTLDGRMPGAGDDGSGSSSVMEMARVLLSSDVDLKNPVYFVWYAAEERGLVGSQYVVEHFLKQSIPVKAVVQFDMTGFRNDRKDQTMWVYRDYTDDLLSNFLEKLITTYLNVPFAESSCGYGCSDHASWTEVDIPAAFPCETDYEHHNKVIHTSKDTIDRLTPEHMVNFAKLGVAFALELAAG